MKVSSEQEKGLQEKLIAMEQTLQVAVQDLQFQREKYQQKGKLLLLVSELEQEWDDL